MSVLNQMPFPTARLLCMLMLTLLSVPQVANGQDPVPESPLPTELQTQLDRLRTQAEGLEAKGREEAAADHYQEALEFFQEVRSLLNQRESLLKEAAREATAQKLLTRLTGELENNARWLGEIKDMVNLLKLSL